MRSSETFRDQNRDVQQAYVGYVYGDSTSGQATLYNIGLSGIPIINVNNNCATGSTALFLARQAIASGAVDSVLALGFEQMAPGALQEHYSDRPTPLARFIEIADETPGASSAPMAIKLFGAAGIEYQRRYGADDAVFASVASKARRHAEHNERAILRGQLTVEEVLASPKMLGPLTRLQCCPPTCGAAAAILGTAEAFDAVIDDRTIMLFASAPCYPYGVFDRIEDIALLAQQRQLWLHVDACWGGFISPFAKELGYPIPLWDFQLPGVTSISADLHKFGYAIKGASLIMFRDGEVQQYERFTTDKWPRGKYSTPAMLGSAPAGSIATAWALVRSDRAARSQQSL
jgi:Pyridoxal-dependent decarboxylase conserved domain/Thiolase, N-terminal domain